MRHLFAGLFALFAFAEEIDLSRYEKTFYSQNGEDGIVAKLVQLICPKRGFCVEFGAFDGVTGSNTYLLRRQGWDCLLLDRGYEIPEFKLHKEYITAQNINQLFEKYQVPEKIDLMSVDIDFNDFYIWKAIDPKYNASILLMEYNASIPPDEDKVVKYHPYYIGDGTNYFGASILAMYRLGRAKGYSLVYAEQTGTNLFFVRDEIVEELEKKGITFKDLNDVEKIYRRPTYGKGEHGGHPDDPKHRPYFTSEELMRKS